MVRRAQAGARVAGAAHELSGRGWAVAPRGGTEKE